MALHRAYDADWSSLEPSEMNRWQRWAARSGGYLTPGNAVTVLGCLIVVAGLLTLLAGRQFAWMALLLILIGRVADLLDGAVADRTGTKSPVGEAVDAAADKIILAVSLPVLGLIGALPAIAVILIILHIVVMVVLYGTAQKHKQRIHPTRAGKLATAAEWATLLLFGLIYGLEPTGIARGGLLVVAYASLAGFATGAGISIYQYANNQKANVAAPEP